MNEFLTREPTFLCEIMGRNKSDKGSLNITKSWHNYTLVYYELFKNIRYEKLRVFELGIGTNNVNLPSNMGVNGKPGASLYGWAEFFPFSQIYGADIDRDILFENERIKCFFCDQTNPQEISKMWSEKDLQENFDIIIEDGLHTYEANICFFENSIHKLKPKGIYIIEDVKHSDFQLFDEKIRQYKREKKYTDLTFELYKLPSFVNQHDNNLIVIKRI